jgi:hypothetical protein
MLTHLRFDTRIHICDCCGRALKDGAVILSDERAYGRNCAATALGRPKADRQVKVAIDALEVAALRALFAGIAPCQDGRPAWKNLRFYRNGMIVSWVAADGQCWEVFSIHDGRLVAALAKVGAAWPKMPAGYVTLAMGACNQRFVDVAAHPALAAAVEEYRRK